MKLYKIIIGLIVLFLLLCICLLPPIYSRAVINLLGWPDTPENIVAFYGEFDVEIINSEYSQYYAYKLDNVIPNGKDYYLVINYWGTYSDETRIRFYTYEGTDWIEEVTEK